MKEQRIRKHPRAKWYEYNEGLYFITVCTKDRKHFFGYITNGEVKLSEIGNILQNGIETISQHHCNVTVCQWVVMPNHFHAIIEITSDIPENILPDDISAATSCGPTSYPPTVGPQPVAANIPDTCNTTADIPNDVSHKKKIYAHYCQLLLVV